MKKIIEAFKQGYRETRIRPDGQPVRVETSSATKHRQSVAATVVRACATCGAPGAWSSDDRVAQGWPGCWVAFGCNAAGYPVGNKCPNCGEARPQDEVLGEVWVKEFV